VIFAVPALLTALLQWIVMVSGREIFYGAFLVICFFVLPFRSSAYVPHPWIIVCGLNLLVGVGVSKVGSHIS
jgi:hypothetical protein